MKVETKLIKSYSEIKYENIPILKYVDWWVNGPLKILGAFEYANVGKNKSAFSVVMLKPMFQYPETIIIHYELVWFTYSGVCLCTTDCFTERQLR